MKAKKRFLKFLTDNHNSKRKKSTVLDDEEEETCLNRKKSYDFQMRNRNKMRGPHCLSTVIEEESFQTKRPSF